MNKLRIPLLLGLGLAQMALAAQPVVTFLSPRSFHLRMANGLASGVPEFMNVKDDTDYPPVPVTRSESAGQVVYATAQLTLKLDLRDSRTITATVISGGHTLIDQWIIQIQTPQMTVGLWPGERIYGFGDKRAALDQRGQSVQIINRDALFSENNDSYKSIPFYMSSTGYGLFFHNFYKSTFDLGATDAGKIKLTGTDGEADFYIFTGADYKDLLTQYTELTGRPAMLPRWFFGYHQSKASYNGRQAFDVAAKMRQELLPIDTIYYDDWVDEAVRKDFTAALWNQFHVHLTMGGNPFVIEAEDPQLLRKMAAAGQLMVDDKRKPVIEPAEEIGGDDGTELNVGYVDFFSPGATAALIAAKWKPALENGVFFGMADFGEMDHIKNSARKFWPSNGLQVEKARNLYGLVYTSALVNSCQKILGGRSMGMVRPGLAGSQRLGWTTTGDSEPTFKNWKAHLRALLNLSLTGFSNIGYDIGGWDKKGPDDVYARWFAAGAFNPFMWAHGQGDHEPYAHGAAVENSAREFLQLRYRMLPLLYSLHEEAARTGVPVLRAPALQEFADAKAATVDDQFFIGNDLLVAPVMNAGGGRKVYLPAGSWYDLFDELPPQTGPATVARNAVPLNRIPAYVRAGGIIPLGPVMQFSSERAVDPLAVHFYAFRPSALGGGSQAANFDLYEDDGESVNYRRGEWQRTGLTFTQSPKSLLFSARVKSGNGTYRSHPGRGYEIYVHGIASAGQVLLNGAAIPRQNSPSAAAGWGLGPSGVWIVIPRGLAQIDLRIEW